MHVLPCLLVGLLVGGGFPISADILYSVTDLDALPGYPVSLGDGINNAGQVTGGDSPPFVNEEMRHF
jgi:hypothetical protein